jgi:hypothetical protein
MKIIINFETAPTNVIPSNFKFVLIILYSESRIKRNVGMLETCI